MENEVGPDVPEHQSAMGSARSLWGDCLHGAPIVIGGAVLALASLGLGQASATMNQGWRVFVEGVLLAALVLSVALAATYRRQAQRAREETKGHAAELSEHAKTEKDLRRLQNQTQNILESIGDALVALDDDWRIIFLNRQAARLLHRRRRRDLIGKIIWDEIPEVHEGVVLEALQTAALARRVCNVEAWIPGLSRWLEVRVYPRNDGIAVYFGDISERKHNEQELHRTSAALAVALQTQQAIMERSLDVIGVFDADGRIIQISRAAERLWGYSCEALVGRRLLELVHPDDVERTAAVEARLYADGSNTDFFNRIVHRDGHVVEMQWTAVWSVDEGRSFRTARDIGTAQRSERLEAGKREILTGIASRRPLFESLDALCRLFEAQCGHGFAAVVLTDSPARALRVAAPTLPASLREGFGERLLSAEAQALQAGQRISVEDVLHEGLTGTVQALPVHTSDGRVVAALALWRVSAAQRSEVLDRIACGLLPIIAVAIDQDTTYRQLANSERRHRELFEHTPLAMAVYDPQSLRFVAVNDTALAAYGYSRERFLEMTVVDLCVDGEVERLRAHLARRPRGLTQVGRWLHRRRNGEQFYADLQAYDVVSNDAPARIVIMHDVSGHVDTERALLEKDEQMQQLLQDVDEAIFVVDQGAHVRFANLAAARLLGQDVSRLVGHDFPVPVANTPADLSEVQDAEGGLHQVEVRTSLTRWRGQPARVYSLRDVTERRRSGTTTRLLERAIQASINGVLIADVGRSDMPVTWANAAFVRISGLSLHEVLGRSLRALLVADPQSAEAATINTALREQRECLVTLRNTRAGGETVWSQVSIVPVRADSGAVTHFLALVTDLTESRRMQAELAYMTSHDTVTGLPRYEFVEDFLVSTIAEYPAEKLQIMFIDVDRLHSVNEALGHAVGDRVLRELSGRLKTVLGEQGRLTRIASDEFVAVLSNTSDAEAERIAEAARLIAASPFESDGFRVLVTVSIGLSRFPEHGRTAPELVRRAEAAAVRAKRHGRDMVCVFSPDEAQEVEDQRILGGRLREAIRLREMELHYQPQFDCVSGRLLGFEALVRWNNPQYGQVSPTRFIPLAESLGLVAELGQWVLFEAGRQLRAWIDAGYGEVKVAVNVSAQQLLRPGLVELVQSVLSEYRLPPSRLELEFTESTLMESVDRVHSTLARLKSLGVGLALDDFGTGYSSLSYLKQFPLDKLKIDRSFVRDLPGDNSDAAIARTIIGMAHQLRLRVVAEGVETQQQWEFLRSHGCDELQGFFFDMPQPVPRATRWLNTVTA